MTANGRDIHISIYLPSSYSEPLNKAMDAGGYKTKTEFGRAAVREKIEREMKRQEED